jgi:ATP-binding cassette subfamily B protein
MAKEGNLDYKLGEAIQRLTRLLKVEKNDIYDIYIYSILAGFLSLSLPLGIQTIIGFVLAGSISNSIVVLITMVLLGTFFNGLLQVRQLELMEKIQQKMFTKYALEFGKRIPQLDMSILENYHLPELVNRFFDIGTLQKSLQKILLEIPAALIQVVLGTILLAFYHPMFIAFGLVLMAIIFLIIRYSSPQGFQTSMDTSDYKYKVAAWFEEMARSIKTFKYAQKTSLNLENTDKLLTTYLGHRTDHFKILKVQYWSLIAFKLLITGVMLILGVILLVDQQINIGQFIAADIVIIAIMGSIEKLISGLDQVYLALTSVEKLNKVAEAPIEQKGTTVLPSGIEGLKVEFKGVSFSYDGKVKILKNISFAVGTGEWVGITGNSGSGKTTVLRLLTGAFRDFEGTILVNGIPLRDYDQLTIREQSGILLTKQDIFKGTLLENITLGNSDITVDDIMNVAEFTGLTNFIQGLPNGLSTIISHEGVKHSSAIRKKIVLTRAVVGKKRLLLLKDPFFFLNDKQMNDLIEYLRKTFTTVIIVSTDKLKLGTCDRVINLHQGEII